MQRPEAEHTGLAVLLVSEGPTSGVVAIARNRQSEVSFAGRMHAGFGVMLGSNGVAMFVSQMRIQIRNIADYDGLSNTSTG